MDRREASSELLSAIAWEEKLICLGVATAWELPPEAAEHVRELLERASRAADVESGDRGPRRSSPHPDGLDHSEMPFWFEPAELPVETGSFAGTIWDLTCREVAIKRFEHRDETDPGLGDGDSLEGLAELRCREHPTRGFLLGFEPVERLTTELGPSFRVSFRRRWTAVGLLGESGWLTAATLAESPRATSSSREASSGPREGAAVGTNIGLDELVGQEGAPRDRARRVLDELWKWLPLANPIGDQLKVTTELHSVCGCGDVTEYRCRLVPCDGTRWAAFELTWVGDVRLPIPAPGLTVHPPHLDLFQESDPDDPQTAIPDIYRTVRFSSPKDIEVACHIAWDLRALTVLGSSVHLERRSGQDPVDLVGERILQALSLRWDATRREVFLLTGALIHDNRQIDEELVAALESGSTPDEMRHRGGWELTALNGARVRRLEELGCGELATRASQVHGALNHLSVLDQLHGRPRLR